MKKYRFVICVLGLLIPTFSQAGVDQSFDELLLQEGIVDSNYKYTDIAAVSQVFRHMNNLLSESLPVKLSSEIEATAVLMTPYASIYSYKYLLSFNDDEKQRINIDLNSAESINEFCKSMYVQKVLIANNHKIQLAYYDIDSKLVAQVKLTPSKCNLFSPSNDTKPPIKSFF